MGLFDGLMFWKKTDETGLGGAGIPKLPEQGIGGMPSDDLGLGLPQQQPTAMQPTQQPLPQPTYHQPESLQSAQGYTANKEMEIISAKLDALRAALDTISQRLANIERAAYGEHQQQPQQYQQYKRW